MWFCILLGNKYLVQNLSGGEERFTKSLIERVTINSKYKPVYINEVKGVRLIFNTALIRLKDYSDEYGHLTPIEAKKDIPFEIKRVYYISKVDPEVRRGFHSHKNLHQLLICVNGSVKIRTNIPGEDKIVELNDQSIGLYIGPMVWREMYDFSPGSVLLVLASDHYDEGDYIRDYDKYVSEASKLFKYR